MLGCIDRGIGRFIHRKGSRYSYMQPCDMPSSTDAGLATYPIAAYTHSTKSKSFRLVTSDEVEASLLGGIRHGNPVLLSMKVPNRYRSKRDTAEYLDKLVWIVPGVRAGTDPGVFLVAVVGEKSVIYRPFREKSSAKLILAGIPGNLANALAAEMRRVLSGVNHAPRAKPSPRRSSSRRGFRR